MKLTIQELPKRKRKRIKSKKGSISSLTKELDTVFSRFVRLSRMDKDEQVQCYTCPFKTHYKKIHAGHYISRWYKTTRWDENNVRPQCFMCNIYKKGNAAVFRLNLIQEIGQEKVMSMEATTTEVWKMGKLEATSLQEKIVHYKEKIKNL